MKHKVQSTGWIRTGLRKIIFLGTPPKIVGDPDRGVIPGFRQDHRRGQCITVCIAFVNLGLLP